MTTAMTCWLWWRWCCWWNWPYVMYSQTCTVYWCASCINYVLLSTLYKCQILNFEPLSPTPGQPVTGSKIWRCWQHAVSSNAPWYHWSEMIWFSLAVWTAICFELAKGMPQEAVLCELDAFGGWTNKSGQIVNIRKPEWFRLSNCTSASLGTFCSGCVWVSLTPVPWRKCRQKKTAQESNAHGKFSSKRPRVF